MTLKGKYRGTGKSDAASHPANTFCPPRPLSIPLPPHHKGKGFGEPGTTPGESESVTRTSAPASQEATNPAQCKRRESMGLQPASGKASNRFSGKCGNRLPSSLGTREVCHLCGSLSQPQPSSPYFGRWQRTELLAGGSGPAAPPFGSSSGECRPAGSSHRMVSILGITQGSLAFTTSGCPSRY